MRQAESIRRLPQVAEALERGRSEVSAMWIDAVTGEPCRCRPDWVCNFGGRSVALLDVKTYSDASPDEFRRQIARKRYHVQDAFYSDGYASATGDDVKAFIFVAVESEWPYAANALMLDERSREQGRVDYRANLDTYSDCMHRGAWPGYGDEIQLIELPSWALTGERRNRDNYSESWEAI
jgi:exodeoxyribonuclease VIII